MNSVSIENAYADAGYASAGNVPAHKETLNDASSNEVRALNGLIVGVLDNIDECRRAVFALEQHVATLQRRLHNRVQAVEQLQSRVRNLGGEPATTRSTLAAAFAKLLAIREPFARNRKEDLLLDVERGEQALKVQFQHLLASQKLSGASRDCVSGALDCVLSERSRAGEQWSSQNVLLNAPAVAQELPAPLMGS